MTPKRLRNLLTMPSPHDSIDPDDPLIYIDLRRLNDTTSPRSLRRLIRRSAAAYAIVGTGIHGASWWIGGRDEYWVAYTLFYVILFAASIIAGITIDTYSRTHGINSLERFRKSDVYPLAKISTLSDRRLIESRYQVATLTVWRAVIQVLIVRIWVLLMGTPLAVKMAYDVLTNPFMPAYEKAADVGLALGVLPPLIYLLLYESLWRYRPLTLISVHAAVRHTSTPMILLRSIVRGLIVTLSNATIITLAGGFITVIPAGLFIFLISSLTRTDLFAGKSLLMFVLSFLLGCTLWGGILFTRRHLIQSFQVEMNAIMRYVERHPR